MGFNHISVSKIGQKRSANEDSVGVFPLDDGLLAVVCDGLGGNKAGEIASRLSVETIRANFISSDSPDYLERIRDAILKASSLIQDKGNRNADLNGMATTAEVLFITKDSAYWGHVGDSRIYFVSNKKLKQVTKDHSLVQKLVDEGYLTLKEAEKHPDRNIILKALGYNASTDIDLSKQKLNWKDEVRFFVCTDGVSSVVDNNEIENYLREKDINVISEMICKLIEDRGAPDNYSFVIIEKT